MADAKPLVNIVELFGSNPYDKDATVVNLVYDPVAGTFTSEDDGSGMTPDDLPEFFLSGDSSKGDPSPIYGRLPHGDFGMAAINLKNLCRKYTMVTAKNGLRTTLSEAFRGPLQLGKIIRPDKVERCSEDEHGTKFVLSGLKFARGFDLCALRTQLQWDLPVADPTFDIYINDSVVEPPRIKGLASFLYRLNGKHMGDVKAVLHVMGRNHEHSGMNVYVRGRRIGLPGALVEYGARKLSFRHRVVGMIDAPGLRNAIQVERRAFNESKASFRELRKAMDPILSDVVRYAVSHFIESSGDILKRNEASTVASIRRRLVGAKLLGRHKASVELVDPNDVGFDSGLPGRLYNNRLLLNRGRASLYRTSKTTSGDFKARLLGTAIQVIASERLPESASAADLVAETDRIWRRLCFSSGSDVSERAESEEQELEGRREDTFHPHLLYLFTRVVKELDIAAPDLRYLRSKQAFDYTGDLLLGSDVRDVQKRMDLYTVSLRRLVQVHSHTPKGDIQTEQTFEGRLGRAGKAIEPFVVDLNKETGKPPCYFTMPLCVYPLNSLLASTIFRRKGLDRPRRAFEEFGAEAYTPTELVEYAHLARDEVDTAIRSAELRGSPLESLSGKRRGVLRYRFRDFVRAHRHHAQIKAQEN